MSLVSEVCDLETTRQGLLRQIRLAEIKLKGISTMIANLRERKQAIQDEIDEIARQFGQDGCDHAALASRMAALRSELVLVKDKAFLSVSRCWRMPSAPSSLPVRVSLR